MFQEEPKEEEPKEEEHNSPFDMIMNVMDHFNLNMIIGHVKDDTVDEMIQMEEMVEVQETTTEKVTPTTTVQVIKEETSDGETIHVVLPMSANPWTTEEPEVGVIGSVEAEEVKEVTTIRVEQEVQEASTTTTTTTTTTTETTTATTTSETTTTTTAAPTTTTEETRAPKIFETDRSSRLNRIRQRLRNPTRSKSTVESALELINSRTTVRPVFRPNSNENTNQGQEEGLEETKVNSLLNRRNQLFKKRVRVSRPQPVVLPDSTEITSRPEPEVAQALRSRFQRLRRPKADPIEVAEKTPEESAETKKSKSVRCSILRRGCEDES